MVKPQTAKPLTREKRIKLRDGIIRDLTKKNVSQTDIAKVMSMSQARVSQIVRPPRR